MNFLLDRIGWRFIKNKLRLKPLPGETPDKSGFLPFPRGRESRKIKALDSGDPGNGGVSGVSFLGGIVSLVKIRHSRAGGNPGKTTNWIPAFAGMRACPAGAGRVCLPGIGPSRTRHRSAGGRRRETGDRKQETGDRKQ
jgi:hypothetical protein